MLTGTRPSWRNFSFFICLLDRGRFKNQGRRFSLPGAGSAANIRAALPDMDEDMAALARQTADKLDTMNNADFEVRQFHFTDE